MGRLQASAIHLLGSGLIALVSAIAVFLFWYPGLLGYASGVASIFLLLLAVDVVAGPFVTLIVFDRKKKELKRDLIVVVFFQVLALLYGLNALFVARPVYLVFNSDRFDVVYANDISDAEIAKAVSLKYRSLPWTGPKLVAAKLPDDIAERNEILFSAVGGGPDVQHMPKYYKPYDDLMTAVAGRVQPLSMLREINNEKKIEVEELIKKYAELKVEVGFVPLKARVNDLSVLINKSSGEIVEIVDLKPWK